MGELLGGTRGMVDKQKLGTFVLGGVAGALAGILLAPRSGKELRGSIASRAGEARERGREGYFEARERARERAAEARDASSVREEELDLSVGPTAEPMEPPPVFPTAAPPLRDVSGEDAVEVEAPPEGDPEELRRRIQETRSRLRARLERPGEGPEGTNG
ncbi:MAG: hypothetical protein CYG60_07635 [Actinobacteria bacterium]|nr:MAG: hypothetical protein CYG60_07635 [Actinomycetota bacterium]